MSESIVIVVEDNRHNRKLASSVGHEGYHVTTDFKR
jgi:hypothetical protein